MINYSIVGSKISILQGFALTIHCVYINSICLKCKNKNFKISAFQPNFSSFSDKSVFLLSFSFEVSMAYCTNSNINRIPSVAVRLENQFDPGEWWLAKLIYFRVKLKWARRIVTMMPKITRKISFELQFLRDTELFWWNRQNLP